MAVPLVAPESVNVPAVVPAIPNVGVDVAVIVFAVAAAKTVPAVAVDGNVFVVHVATPAVVADKNAPLAEGAAGGNVIV